MKVAHLTLLHGYNYGGMLQAYATQAILKELGHDVETVDYHPWKKHGIIRRSSLFCRPVYERARKFLDNRDFAGVDAFDRFRTNNFKFSAPCQTPRQLAKVCKDKDFVAVGSDQVWSAAWRRAPYFIDFELPEKCKRISLSACCGSPSPDDQFRRYFGNTISRFDAISVRNDFTANLVRETTGRNPEILCDPTLACKIPLEPISGLPASYALVYVINRPKSHNLGTQAISQLKRETNLPVVSVPPTELKGQETLPCETVMSGISPFQWAWLVANATCVITDSFHGTVFAAKYHKPIAILDSGFAANKRLHAIAADLNIQDSIISSDSALNFRHILETQSNWETIDSIIQAKAAAYRGFVSTNISCQ